MDDISAIASGVVTSDDDDVNHAKVMNSQLLDDNAPAIVSLSGGLDSTSCLFWAVKYTGASNIIAVTVEYGQRHEVEVLRAKRICNYMGVEHRIISLAKVFNMNSSVSSLMAKSGKEVEQGKDYSEIEGIPSTYVPNRNMVMASVLGSIGMQCYPNQRVRVVLGIHQSDADAAYPDCTMDFADKLHAALVAGSGGMAELVTPLINMKKVDVVRFGIKNGMGIEDFDNTWSCYNEPIKIRGRHKVMQCGKCPTCRERIKALVQVGLLRSPRDVTARYKLTQEEAEEFFN